MRAPPQRSTSPRPGADAPRRRAPGRPGRPAARRRSAPALAALVVTAGLAGFGALGAAGPARATPLDFVPVGDPLEAELRVLDLFPAADDGFPLPRLHARPLQRVELAPGAAWAAPGFAPAGVAAWRVARALAPDVTLGPQGGADPLAGRGLRRAFRRAAPGTALEASLGIEGRGEAGADTARLASGSGLHARVAARVERWLAYAHVLVGRVDGARTFADPIVTGTDVIAHTEETYLAYAPESGRWAAQFGRSRWHWGPGEEGSLVLSKTSPAITGLAFRATLAPWRVDLVALNATLAASAGEQLAAHRVEWQPRDGLRLGVTEAARYRADGWRPLYALGAVPYVLVQRLEQQDEPDSLGALRNNVMVAVDAAWRIVPGLRAYGEVLLDDVSARTADNPDRLALQLGLEGAAAAGGRRVTWGVEWTRLSRYVYTSSFGRAHAARGEPLGYPAGPGARRVRLRATLDPTPDWQVFARAARGTRGAEGLDAPFVPGAPRPDVWSFAPPAGRADELEAGLRWWPAGGVDLSLAARWGDAAGGGAGDAAADGFGAALEVRLTR